MNTKRLDIINGNYEKAINEAAELLKNGGIVAIPTETVYGLAASAFSDEAIKKVFIAKGRPQDNPLIVHISDIDMLKLVAREIPEKAIECAKRFWPGPFTMVLKKSENIAESVSAGLRTVAVRMPSDKTARDIIKKSGLPLAAPSANLSGSPSPTTAYHTLSDLDTRVDAVVMGGDCEVGVESTVVALFGDQPRLLRPGAVTVESLKEILPDLIVDKAVLSEAKSGEKVASPGMKYKHYAPKTEAFLVEGGKLAFADFVNAQKDAAALCFDEELALIKIKKLSYGDEKDPKTLARNIFTRLREADLLNVQKIYIHAPSKDGIGLAVYNRLIRAAAFKIIILKGLVIGLTGPTGSGKSMASNLAQEKEINVIDCDKLARVAVEKGTEGLNALCKVFGNGILNSDGTLNRKSLAKIAFSSPENTEILNKTLLPHIARLVEDNIVMERINILDAPTLFESGIDKICDKTVAVLADKETRLARITSRDNISTEEALLRISAGKPDQFYIKNADSVIYNNAEKEKFLSEFNAFLETVIGG